MITKRKNLIPFILAAATSGSAFGIFIDGHGSYGIRGETRTKPSFSDDKGVYQSADQFFRLDTEVRTSDRASFFLEFRLFGDQRQSHLGDDTQLNECPPYLEGGGPFTDSQLGRNTDCDGAQQNALEPRYAPYAPRVTKAYAQYATDYCLLTVGRRGRNWGMGILLDDGRDRFDTDASVYDGITCDINLQKSQTMGFSIGYDKISETGGPAVANTTGDDTEYGSTNKTDDLDQLFFTIEYNDHKMNAGQGFSQQIGIYFANIFGGKNTGTDIKLADLYLNFVLSDLVIQNEVLFRLGESGDPNLALLGGLRTYSTELELDKKKNNVQSIAAAGSIEYYLSRSGSNLGPANYRKGNATSHSIFLSYAYAPGDSDGYFPDYSDPSAPLRDQKVGAVAFHRNFKPAMILFNGNRDTDQLRVDGIFDPYRVMNATVVSLGYRYKSLENGDFEAKVIGASLNEAITEEAMATYTDSENRPIGYAGTDLGVEFDISYAKSLGQGLEFGISGAVAKGGDAWKRKDSQEPADNFLLQSHISFSF